jgi:hypothetical protein
LGPRFTAGSRAALTAALLLCGCTTSRLTNPPRSAAEQLLISTATDHAVDSLQLKIPAGARVFVDGGDFEGYDAKYALGALSERVLRLGGRLVTDKSKADLILLPRAGALSIDENNMLVGIPSIDIPVPLMGNLSLPQLALFAKEQAQGVAKFAVVLYDANNGTFTAASSPFYGFSHRTHWVVALLFSWSTNDLLPKDVKQ